MRHFHSLLLLLLLGIFLSATGQTPQISFLDRPGFTETNPVLYPALNGGFILSSSYVKTNPDSTIASLSLLSPALVPQWTRVFKIRASTTINFAEQVADGKINLLVNSYNTQPNYITHLATLSPEGNLVESLQLVDSSSATQTRPFFTLIKLQN